MVRSFLMPALAVCAAGLFTPAVAPAQTKVGIINLQRAILQTAEIKKASADMQTKYKPRQDALEKLQTQLTDIQNKLASGQGKLTASQEADLNDQGARVQRDAQRMSDDLQADVEADRNDVVQKAGQRMVEVVKKLADDKTLDVVIDSANTVFWKTALEITDDAIAAYDKAYPVK